MKYEVRLLVDAVTRDRLVARAEAERGENGRANFSEYNGEFLDICISHEYGERGHLKAVNL